MQDLVLIQLLSPFCVCVKKVENFSDFLFRTKKLVGITKNIFMKTTLFSNRLYAFSLLAMFLVGLFLTSSCQKAACHVGKKEYKRKMKQVGF